MKSARIAAAVLVVVGCSTFAISAESGERQSKIISADRQEIGAATFRETPNGVLVRLEVQNTAAKISPGAHAVHLHEVEQCEPPFKLAGAHLNLSKKKHGFLRKEGAHTGDLPNIHVPQSGPLHVEMIVAAATLSGGGKTNLLDADGFSLVIHQQGDDYGAIRRESPAIGSPAQRSRAPDRRSRASG